LYLESAEEASRKGGGKIYLIFIFANLENIFHKGDLEK